MTALFADWFAGAGGNSLAVDLAANAAPGRKPGRARLALAANHWAPAVRTHSHNYGADAEHLIGDLATADPKRFPRAFTQYLVASPECDTWSNARNLGEAIAELGEWTGPNTPISAAQRSRVLMWTPVVWAAYHRFMGVFLENVVEVVSKMRHFDAWCREFEAVGYRLRLLSLNAAFIGFGPMAPVAQSRDRLFIVATRRDLPEPDLDFTVRGVCRACGEVDGVQTWKTQALRRAAASYLGQPVGKYGIVRGQYFYACQTCRSAITPYTMPAYTALRGDLPCPIIGQREKPLAPKTLARVNRSLDLLFAERQLSNFAVPLDRLGDPSKRPIPEWQPFPTVTSQQTFAYVKPGDCVQVDLRGTNAPRSVDEPTSTVAASGNHHALVMANNENNVGRDVGQPVGAVTTGSRHYVVDAAPGVVAIAQNGGAQRARPVDHEPLGTLTAGGHRGCVQQALVAPPALAFTHTSGPRRLRRTTQEPLATVTTGGDATCAPIALLDPPHGPHLTAFYGRSSALHDTRDPHATLSGRAHHGIVDVPPAGGPDPQRTTLVRCGGPRQAEAGRRVDEPAPTRMPSENLGLAEAADVGGRPAVEDCGLRMVSAGECVDLMGLGVRYRRGVGDRVDAVPYEVLGSNATVVKQAGNAVCQPVVAAIIDRVLTAHGA